MTDAPTRRDSDGLRLLFLVPFAPDLRGSHGGARATGSIIEMLSKDYRTSILYLAGAHDAQPRQLPSGCESVFEVRKEARPQASGNPFARLTHAAARLVSPHPKWVKECWSGAIASRIAAAVAQFRPDVVHFEFHVMAQYIPLVRSVSRRAACVITEHEPGISADAPRVRLLALRQWVGALQRHRAWRRYERKTLPKADAIITFTSSDAAALRRLLAPSSPPITVIPFRVPESGSSAPASAEPVRSDFLFIGNFDHPPNTDAARRLVNVIFPMIKRDLPDAKLTIVGANPPDDLVNAGSDGVTVTGWVDDPSIYLGGAAVVLVPLRHGGGLRVKMLESCGAGKAIVASRLAIEGLSLRDGNEVVLAESEEEFAKAATALINDPERRARLEISSRRWWEKEQDVARWSDEYAALYATLPTGGRNVS